MTVYVDSAFIKYGRMQMCHLFADTDEELHHMASMLGVARKWWQSPAKTSGSHYYICKSKRELALKLGAVAITWRQAGAMNRRRNVTGQLGSPEDAEMWLQLYFEKLRKEKHDVVAARQNPFDQTGT